MIQKKEIEMDEDIRKYIDSIQNDSVYIRLSKLYFNMDSNYIKYYIRDNFEKFKQFYELAQYYEENPGEFCISDYLQNGSINLDDVIYIDSKTYPGAGCFVSKWIILPNLDTYLIKNKTFVEPKIKNHDHHILIASKLASKMGIKTAQYYLLTDDQGNMTKNFLEPDESLMPFTFAITPRTTNVVETVNGLEKFLVERGVSKDNVETTRREYIKLAFFNKFIMNEDDVLRNLSLTYRKTENGTEWYLSHGYDYDYSFDIYKLTDVQGLPLSDGTTSVASFIKDFKDEEWFIEFVQEFIRNFNANDILAEVQEEHRMIFDSEELEYYTSFFDRQLEEVKSAVRRYMDYEEPMM